MLYHQLTEQGYLDKDEILKFQETRLSIEETLANRKILNKLDDTIVRFPKYYKICAAMYGSIGMFLRPNKHLVPCNIVSIIANHVNRGHHYIDPVEVGTYMSLKFPYKMTIKTPTKTYGDVDESVTELVKLTRAYFRNMSDFHKPHVKRGYVVELQIPIEHPLSEDTPCSDLFSRF